MVYIILADCFFTSFDHFVDFLYLASCRRRRRLQPRLPLRPRLVLVCQFLLAASADQRQL